MSLGHCESWGQRGSSSALWQAFVDSLASSNPAVPGQRHRVPVGDTWLLCLVLGAVKAGHKRMPELVSKGHNLLTVLLLCSLDHFVLWSCGRLMCF